MLSSVCKISFILISLCMAGVYVTYVRFTFKDKSLTYTSLKLLLLVIPVLYFFFGNIKSLEYLSLPKIQAQITEYKNIRPLIASVERKSTKMGMLCDLEPENVDNWWQYGQLLELQKRHEEAKIIYVKAHDLHPMSVPILERIVLLELKEQKGLLFYQTNLYANKIKSIQGENIVANHAIALSKYQKGRFKESVSIWKKIISDIKTTNNYTNITNDIGKIIAKAVEYESKPQIKIEFIEADKDFVKLKGDYIMVTLKLLSKGPPIVATKYYVDNALNSISLGPQFALDISRWDNISRTTKYTLEFYQSKEQFVNSESKLLKTIMLDGGQVLDSVTLRVKLFG